MTDINAVIARYKGWEYNDKFAYPWILNVEGQKRGHWSKTPPDFKHDAGLYMALAEEMLLDGVEITLNYDLGLGYIVNWQSADGKKYGEESCGNNLGTAVCLAYMRLHGLECEG